MTDPRPTFSYLASELAKRHQNLAFIHLVESRVEGSSDRDNEEWEVRSRILYGLDGVGLNLTI